MKEKRIILIGGAPTTGKSTIAQALSKHLDLPWISTDQIRNTMRVVADKQEYPDLFNGGFDAGTFLTKFTSAEIVDKEFVQSKAAWLGIRAFIEEDYTWPRGFIMEGVNILPHLVAADFGGQSNVTAIFLVDHDENRMREVIYSRGLWADARTYSDDVKEKEVEWALLFTHRLGEAAKQHNFPCIEIHKNKNDIHRILSALTTR